MIEANLPHGDKGCYHAHLVECNDQRLGTNGNPYGVHNRHHCNMEGLGRNLDRHWEGSVERGVTQSQGTWIGFASGPSQECMSTGHEHHVGLALELGLNLKDMLSLWGTACHSPVPIVASLLQSYKEGNASFHESCNECVIWAALIGSVVKNPPANAAYDGLILG